MAANQTTWCGAGQVLFIIAALFFLAEWRIIVKMPSLNTTPPARSSAATLLQQQPQEDTQVQPGPFISPPKPKPKPKKIPTLSEFDVLLKRGIEEFYAKHGGSYSDPDPFCAEEQAKTKTGPVNIVIAYRNRPKHLEMMLPAVRHVLRSQKNNWTITVVNDTSPASLVPLFNRGTLT